MPTNNAINNTSNPLAATAVTIDPGASGDSYIDFKINTVQKYRVGVDDSDGDAYVIAPTALGTGNLFRMSANGECNKPLTPAWLDFLGTADTNVTGNGATYTLGSGNALTEVFDQANSCTTAGVMTAPITGRYLMSVSSRLTNNTTSLTITSSVVSSNRTISTMWGRASSSLQMGRSWSVLIDMDAGDTMTVTTVATGQVGNTLTASAPNATNYTSGFLAC